VNAVIFLRNEDTKKHPHQYISLDCKLHSPHFTPST